MLTLPLPPPPPPTFSHRILKNYKIGPGEKWGGGSGPPAPSPRGDAPGLMGKTRVKSVPYVVDCLYVVKFCSKFLSDFYGLDNVDL